MAQTPLKKNQPLESTAPYEDTSPPSGGETPGRAVLPGFLVLAEGQMPVDGYALEERLGRGGFGEVWRAQGPGGFKVAMKFIVLEGRSGRLEKRSLELMKQIQHPHLLAMFGAWEKDGTLIIAMELGRCTLLQRLNEAVRQGWLGIPPTELLEYMRDAARGIDYLNEPVHKLGDGPPQGIQHRDIKPQNLLLVGSGLKVADFGLARLLEQSVMEVSNSMTPAYAAPEQFNNQASRWSDQYSLAITYCHLRANALPFAGNAHQIVAGHLTQPPNLTMLPDPERPVVARALAKEPARRWPNCRAFVDALGEVIQGDARKKPAADPIPGKPVPKTVDAPVRFKTVEDEYQRFACPKCGQMLRVKGAQMDRRLRCTQCKTLIQAQVPAILPRLPVRPEELPPDAWPRHRGVSGLRKMMVFFSGLLIVLTSGGLTLLLLWAVFLWWRNGAWPGL
jgi:serine/threonine protein kinase